MGCWWCRVQLSLLALSFPAPCRSSPYLKGNAEMGKGGVTTKSSVGGHWMQQWGCCVGQDMDPASKSLELSPCSACISNFLIMHTLGGRRGWIRYVDPWHPGGKSGWVPAPGFDLGPTVAAGGYWEIDGRAFFLFLPLKLIKKFFFSYQIVGAIVWGFALQSTVIISSLILQCAEGGGALGPKLCILSCTRAAIPE